MAEVLQYTGKNAEAKRIASERLKSARLSKALQSRCHTILGHVLVDEEGTGRSVKCFQKAITIAQAAGDLHQVCRAQLKLLTSVSDVSSPQSVAALSSELAHNVARSGDS